MDTIAVSVVDLSANKDGSYVGSCDALMTWIIKLSVMFIVNEIMHVQLAVCWMESTALFSGLCRV